MSVISPAKSRVTDTAVRAACGRALGTTHANATLSKMSHVSYEGERIASLAP